MPSHIRSFSAVCQECEKRFNLDMSFCAVVNLDTVGFETDGFADGSLNRVVCPFCDTEFTYEIPMIVFSMERKFACLVCPGPKRASSQFYKGPPALLLPEGFKFRLVRYLIEAREKYNIELCGCDDVEIEYIKLVSFDDNEALPFDERNIIFKAASGNRYTFEQVDYNEKVIKSYQLDFDKDKIPEAIVNLSKSLSGSRWHKIDRISLKEEIICQNIKISL